MRKIIIGVMGRGENATANGTVSEIALALKANKQVILLNNDVESKVFFQKLWLENVYIVESGYQAIATAKTILY